MNLSEIMTLFDYNAWATRRVLDAAGRLDPDRYIAPAEFPHGGLRGTLVHLAGAEWVWRVRIQEGQSPAASFSEQDFATLQVLRRRWESEQDAWQIYLNGLEPADLDSTIAYRQMNGQERTNLLWHLLVHLVNHGTQHRSEAAALLTHYGRSPGDLDLILYLRQV